MRTLVNGSAFSSTLAPGFLGAETPPSPGHEDFDTANCFWSMRRRAVAVDSRRKRIQPQTRDLPHGGLLWARPAVECPEPEHESRGRTVCE